MAEGEATKSKTEYTPVTMSDGRTVQFAGKKKVLKETLIDDSKIVIEGDVMQLQAGAVKVRMDFRSGETRTLDLPLALFARFAGHGGEQKFGDELASPADKPLSPEDMVVAIDDLYAEISKGNWGKGRAEGGGAVAGAGIVVQAVHEYLNTVRKGKGLAEMSLADVKAYLQKKLDDSAARDGDAKLTRRALYDSFRADSTPTAPIIKRLEAERDAQKKPKVDTAAVLEDATQ